ncbi:two-component system response regulator YesN [Paenibacillus phyllosphaerae]|uniref:Two-component system response regulator YesN n=1 Tax=Paenibacillus phyllosphaerae TaxID=274593 RepID=A0A7W5AZW6_9BACL|nr:response regulator [Paenibacillus phyllosphaerae]MBB3111847.1 two-component system response regulator YesN [Paenibacillus phyllosphaerae]
MHRILIVDDETIFRRGLRKMIESSGSGVWEVVGEAKDGYDALEQIEQLAPDVLLTDIRMPRMDGISLQQIVKERFPKLRVIVLSGYDEFTYLQQSLRHGVRDYLMKPVEREELFHALGKLAVELDAAQKEQESHAPEPPDAARVRQQVSEHLVAGLLRGEVHASELALLGRIGRPLDEPCFACMIIKLDKDALDQDRYAKADPSLFQLYIQQMVQELLDQKAKGFAFVISDTEVVALINVKQQPQAEEELTLMSASIRKRMISLSNLTVTIGLGRILEGADSIPQSFAEARIALLHRLIVGGDRVLSYSQTRQSHHELALDVKEWSWDLLETAIYEGKIEETQQLVRTFITDLCQHAKSPETIHQQLCKLLIYYYEQAEKLQLTKAWLGDKTIQSAMLELCSITSRAELIDLCSRQLGRLAGCMAKSPRQQGSDPIERALRYVKQHYRQPLTLRDVAEHVYLNPAYFCTLFKQRTGKSLVEYWTDLRIHEAKKQLSSSNEKVTVIAESIGFGNVRHFNRVFKNATGATPNDYREQARAMIGHS